MSKQPAVGADTTMVRPEGRAEAAPDESTGARTDWRWPCAVAVIHAVVFAPVIISSLFRPGTLFPNLWLWHAARIPETFRTPTEPIQPHFGWPGTAKLLDIFLPTSDPRVAAALVSIAAAAFFGVVLFLLLRFDDDRRGLLSAPVAAAASVAIALFESPAALQGWQHIGDPSRSFLPLYYSFVPTTLAAMGFNVLLIGQIGRLITGRVGPTGRRWLPALVIATAIVKPNLVPALAVVGLIAAAIAPRLVDRSRDGEPDTSPSAVADVFRLVTVPAIAVVAVQYAILAWFSPPMLKGGISIRPFYEMRLLGGFGWQFWLLLVQPLVALVLLRRKLLADVATLICFGCLAAGILASLLIARSGETFYQGEVGGDLLQLASAATAVAIIFIIRRLAVLHRQARLPRATAAACIVLLVPYLAAGVSTWVCHTGIRECYPDEVEAVWPQPGIDQEIRNP